MLKLTRIQIGLFLLITQTAFFYIGVCEVTTTPKPKSDDTDDDDDAQKSNCTCPSTALQNVTVAFCGNEMDSKDLPVGTCIENTIYRCTGPGIKGDVLDECDKRKRRKLCGKSNNRHDLAKLIRKCRAPDSNVDDESPCKCPSDSPKNLTVAFCGYEMASKDLPEDFCVDGTIYRCEGPDMHGEIVDECQKNKSKKKRNCGTSKAKHEFAKWMRECRKSKRD